MALYGIRFTVQERGYFLFCIAIQVEALRCYLIFAIRCHSQPGRTPSTDRDNRHASIGVVVTELPLFDHLKEAWECKHHPNMLFLFYEELIQDLPAVIRRVAHFLGKDLTDDQMIGLCDHLSFKNFKKNKSVNFDELRERGVFSSEEVFIRKDKAGGWRDHFDKEMIEEATQWIEDNLRDTDLRFPNL